MVLNIYSALHLIRKLTQLDSGQLLRASSHFRAKSSTAFIDAILIFLLFVEKLRDQIRRKPKMLFTVGTWWSLYLNLVS